MLLLLIASLQISTILIKIIYRDEQFLMEVGMEFDQCCRRAVAEGTPTKISRGIWYLEKYRIVHQCHMVQYCLLSMLL